MISSFAGWRKEVENYLHRLEYAVFPPKCVITEAPGLPGLDLSAAQLSLLKRHAEVCPVCGEDSLGCRVCGACVSVPPAFDKVTAAFDFDEVARELVHQFKYQNQWHLSQLLADLMQPKLDMSEVEAIVPVPLHLSRLQERGFNQSLELAKCLTLPDEVRILSEGVKRQKATLNQANLNAKGRQQNLKGAFQIDPAAFSGIQKIALLDDVMTTGATMNAMAQQIKQQTEVKYIEAWCFAKTRKADKSIEEQSLD